MSHFTVLVVTPDEPTNDVLEAALLPFHEYECTGIESYLQFVPYADFESDYAAHGDGATRAQFARDWYGERCELRDGAWGRMTNPNKQWDWWRVGGRWSNLLLCRNGAFADSARKDAIDFDGMTATRATDRIKRWGEYLKECGKQRQNDDKADARARWLAGIPEDMDRETYLATDPGFTTFAVLKDGVWHEKGSMGWWAIVSDEKADWPAQYRALLDTVSDDAWLTVVDCHI